MDRRILWACGMLVEIHTPGFETPLRKLSFDGWLKWTINTYKIQYLLSQWRIPFVNFWGIPYLVGKISRSNFFFRVHWLSESKMYFLNETG